MKTIIITVDDIRRIVQKVSLNTLMDDLIDRLTQAFVDYDPEAYDCPPRTGFTYDEPYTGLVEWMPIMAQGSQATIKVVSYHPKNPQVHQLPTILATTSSYDTTSGHLIGLADSTFLTALRTGAASAVASQLLAQPVGGTIGMIGAGAQAITQLHALTRVFKLERALVCDIDPQASHSFAERVGFLGMPIEVVAPSQLNRLVQTVDILCTATSNNVGGGPVFDDVGGQPWLHINAVGSDFPGKTEVPLSLLQRSVVVPDFPEQAMKEGECQQLLPEQVGPSLVELVQRPSIYKHLTATTTVFDSTGWALEDKVALEMLMGYAVDLNIGHFLQIEGVSADPKDPYLFLKDKPRAAMTSGAVNGRPPAA
jgi:ornithine cyclodeaminase/alanine dehydrogenase-like protein (mu-crystallin family)